MNGNDATKDSSVVKTANSSETEQPPPSLAVRSEMVDAARRFMMMPKVRETSLEQQRQFLLQKGLRQEEIQEALKGLPPAEPYRTGMATGQYTIVGPNSAADLHSGAVATFSPSSDGGFLSVIKYSILITGFSYAGWHLVRSIIWPRFFGASKSATDEEMHATKEAVDEMRDELRSVLKAVGDISHVIKAQQIFLSRNIRQSINAPQIVEIQKSIQNINAMLAKMNVNGSSSTPTDPRICSAGSCISDQTLTVTAEQDATQENAAVQETTDIVVTQDSPDTDLTEDSPDTGVAQESSDTDVTQKTRTSSSSSGSENINRSVVTE